MDYTKLKEIEELYNLLDIPVPVEDNIQQQENLLTLKLDGNPFGIYTENGFNYSTSTKQD